MTWKRGRVREGWPAGSCTTDAGGGLAVDAGGVGCGIDSLLGTRGVKLAVGAELRSVMLLD